jgi:hypothetical protein
MRRVYPGTYGPLPAPERLTSEAASVAVSIAQDALARVVSAIESLEIDAIDEAIVTLRDYEFDLAAYLTAASRRRRELADA